MEIVFGSPELSGYFVQGKGPEDKKKVGQKSVQKPGLVICHDFPVEGDAPTGPGHSHRPLADRIAKELSWSVLLVDYRGCGNSKGDFSMLNWLEDVCQAVQYLRDKSTEVWAVGFGIGGALALCAAAKLKEIKGVVSAGAPADFSNLADNATQFLEYAAGLRLISDLPLSSNDRELWKKDILALEAEKCSRELAPRPLLVIHGSDDGVVSSLDARAIADAHTDAEIRIMEGVTHQLGIDPRVLAVIMGWLDRQAPGIAVDKVNKPEEIETKAP